MLFALPYTAQNKHRPIIRFYNNEIYKIVTYENQISTRLVDIVVHTESPLFLTVLGPSVFVKAVIKVVRYISTFNTTKQD